MKRFKTLGILFAFIMLACCLALTGLYMSKAAAATNLTPSSLFEQEGSGTKVEILDNASAGLKLTLKDSAAVGFKANIDMTDLFMEIKLANKNFEYLYLTFTGEDKDSVTVKNIITIKKVNDTELKVKLNDKEESTLTVTAEGAPSIIVEFDSDTRKFTVNNAELDGKAKATDWPIAKLSFDAAGVGTGEAVIHLLDINGENFTHNAEHTQVVDARSPELMWPAERNPDVMQKNYQYEFKFKIIDNLLHDTTTTVTAQLKDEDLIEEGVEYCYVNGTKIIFYVPGIYKISLTMSDRHNTRPVDVIEIEIIENDTEAPVYDRTKDGDYQTLLDELCKEFDMNEEFVLPFPFVTDNVSKPEFMAYTIRYMSPSSSTFSTSQISNYHLTMPAGATGQYLVQIAPMDLAENQTSYDDCPIFKINVRDYTKPKLTTDSFPEVGYLDIAMSLKSKITISDSSGYTVMEESLQYEVSPGVWEAVTESEGVFEEGTFTPVKLGKYRYMIRVADTYLNESSTEWLEFEVEKAVSTVKIGDWFKENYLSVIFLSVAVLCAAAILTLIIIDQRAKKKLNDE